nr:MAG TPA: hypothetical protein [Caudoviricetes sp.]
MKKGGLFGVRLKIILGIGMELEALSYALSRYF